ncbi:ATPase, partial [Microbacterium sp. C5A9]|nr:ATPase [Microbacterium sp. C5A9]
MPSASAVLAVDLGKSRCRAVLIDAERRVVHDGVGAPGLAARGGVAAALAAV